MLTQARKSGVGWLMAIALVCAIGLVSGTAYGTTYYVATSGNDTNSGTSQGSPFKTIQKGIDTANAGDTVEVAAGSYRQKLVFDSNDGGTPAAPVTVHGASGAIIDASNSGSDNLSWTLQQGYGGGVYTANLGYNTNAVFVNDYSIQEVYWPNASAWNENFNPWFWTRMFTHGLENVSGLPAYDFWGAIPEGWDGVRALAMVNTDNNYLWLKCRPDGESGNPLDITQQTVKISDFKAVGITISGANDVIVDGFTVKYAYYGVWVDGGSTGCEIKNCVLKPCVNGLWIQGGANGVSFHNNECTSNRMNNTGTKNRADNVWHMNKSHLEITGYQDKWGILCKESKGNHHIYDNWIHDIGVGCGIGPNMEPNESILYDYNVEVNHNLIEHTYQDGFGFGRNQTNSKWHHNVINDSLQLGRLHEVHYGPGYIYNNIFIAGPITHNGLIFYMDHPGYAPDIYFYHNTITLSPDCAYMTEPGCVNQEAWHLNNIVDGGNAQVNHHIYNNLIWGDRWLKNYELFYDSPTNCNTYLSEALWDGDYNVYVRRGGMWQQSGGVWSVVNDPSPSWKDNIYSHTINCTSYGTTSPAGGQAYAQNQGIDLNSLWTTAAVGFTNFANGDLSLTSSSPARGEGTNLTTAFGFTPPGNISTDCGALAYGTAMLDVPGTSGGADSKPWITSMAPSTGLTAGGANVTLTGSSLTGATVKFGSNSATSVAVNPSGSHLTCVSPAGSSGTCNVTVITSLGTSGPLTFTYSDSSNNTLSPVADTLIAAASPTTNYGTGNNFQVQNNGTGYHVQSLLKFDLSSLSGTVTSAKLQVYKNGATSTITVTASDCTDDSWSETGVNWNNKPTKGSARATVDATATGWKEWDLTTYVGEQIGGYITIYLTDEVNQRNVWTQWWSREYATTSLRPVLIVATGAGSGPTLSGISPASGGTAGGTACTLTGTNLTGCSAVSFGGVAASGIVVDSSTQVRCTSPSHSAGTVSVTAITSGGTSGGVNYVYTVPAPTLTSISPTSGTTSGGTSVNLTGTNFTGATAVKFGTDNAVSFTENSSTSITATSGSHVAGGVSVTVITPGGTSGGQTYTFVASTPTLSAISPGSGGTGGGTACTLTGTNLIGTTSVSFGGTAGTSIVVDSPTQVRCTSPAKSAGTYSVTATTAGGTSNGVNFIYTTVAPTLSSLSPSSGPAAGGTAVTLTGTGLTGCSAVSFGGTAATGIVVDSSTQVRCTNPAKSAGTYSVTATTPGGTSNGVNFIYVAAPTLSSLSPTSGPAAGGTAVTLTGTALTGCSAVSFGGTAATGIVVDSSTQVRCTSPAKSAGTYSVTATTPGGTSNGINYVYTGGTSYTTTLAPTKDALVWAQSTNTNYGAQNNFQVQANGPSWTMESYLQFSLSSVSGSTVTSAKLRLYKMSGTVACTVTAMSVSVDSWLESTIKWSNRPSKGSAQAAILVGTTNNVYYEWNITSYVNTEFGGDKTVSIDMSDEIALDNKWTQWASKEYSGTNKDPQLVVISQ